MDLIPVYVITFLYNLVFNIIVIVKGVDVVELFNDNTLLYDILFNESKYDINVICGSSGINSEPPPCFLPPSPYTWEVAHFNKTVLDEIRSTKFSLVYLKLFIPFAIVALVLTLSLLFSFYAKQTVRNKLTLLLVIITICLNIPIFITYLHINDIFKILRENVCDHAQCRGLRIISNFRIFYEDENYEPKNFDDYLNMAEKLKTLYIMAFYPFLEFVTLIPLNIYDIYSHYTKEKKPNNEEKGDVDLVNKIATGVVCINRNDSAVVIIPAAEPFGFNI